MTPEQLQKIDRFSGLEPDLLTQVLERSHFGLAQKGDFLFHEGDESDSLVTLIEGYAKVYRTASDGAEILMAIFGPGESVGELALFQGMNYPANAKTLTLARFIRTGKQDYQHLQKASSWFLKSAMTRMSDRANLLTIRMVQIVDGDVDARLKTFLGSVCKKFGTINGDKRFSIPFTLTRQEMASAVNARTETVIRIVSGWSKEGLITTDDGSLIIDPIIVS